MICWRAGLLLRGISAGLGNRVSESESSKENVKSCMWDGKNPVQVGYKWLESSFAEKRLAVFIVKLDVSRQESLWQ